MSGVVTMRPYTLLVLDLNLPKFNFISLPELNTYFHQYSFHLLPKLNSPILRRNYQMIKQHGYMMTPVIIVTHCPIILHAPSGGKLTRRD
jgi:hypothetical protein